LAGKKLHQNAVAGTAFGARNGARMLIWKNRRPATAAGLRWLPEAAVFCALTVLTAAPGHAQTTTAPSSDQSSSPAAPSQPGFFGDLLDPSRTNLLGDMFGLRVALGQHGITLSATDTDEWLGNVSGGFRRGATYEGLTTVTIQLDTQKAGGWAGGLFNVSGLQIRGFDLSQHYLGTLQTASGIEASDTTRFSEIWYDQTFLGGKVDVKIGQQSIDQEFLTNAQSSLFINTALGWPILPSEDLYASGPSYPLSSLGVRLRVQPGGGFTVLGGVFQDNPPGGPFNDDSDLRGTTLWGANFNLRTGALFITEVQYALNPRPTDQTAHPNQQPGLPGTYKFGFWYDTASFPSPRYDTTGISLANPDSNGMPQMLLRNFSVYAIADQTVWQPDPKAPRALGVFASVTGAPGKNNLVSFSANGGVTLKAPLPNRDNDTFGAGFGIVKLSGPAIGLSQNIRFFTQNPAYPVRSSETFLEIMYIAQVASWLQVQPDFQYVFNPGGGIPNPSNPTQRISNEAVLGVRTNVTF
jgi:porin